MARTGSSSGAWVEVLLLCVLVALVVLLAIGLWQSYGGWLLDSGIA